MKKIALILVSIFLVTALGFGQSSTVTQLEKTTNGYKLYLYQSLIRVMNTDKNPDFNMLIRDLDHLKVVTSDANGPVALKAAFTSLDKSVKAEGFEVIMSVDNKDYKCHLMEKTSWRGDPTYVASFLMDGYAGVLEMKGTIDLNYINALKSLDMDKLKELAPDGIENWD